MKYLGLRADPKDIVTQDQLAALGQVFRIEHIATATVGQTSYTVPNGYTPGAVMAFYNGALLQPSDYTATSGTSIVLTEGADTVNDVLSVGILSALRAQDDALLQYSVAGLPPASSSFAKIRYCTDMSGGAGPVFSNGTNWFRVSDNTLVTT